MTLGRLRVLRIIDRLNVGGPALQATVLSEGLDPARFDHRLLAGEISPDEGDYVTLRAPDLPVERIAGLGRSPHFGNDAQALWHISEVIRGFRPHIVHTHKAKAGVLGRVAAWTHRVPATVHHYHGHLLTGYFSPSKTKLVAGVERAMARPTTALVAVGAQVRDELLAAGIGRRDAVLDRSARHRPRPRPLIEPPRARRSVSAPTLRWSDMSGGSRRSSGPSASSISRSKWRAITRPRSS